MGISQGSHNTSYDYDDAGRVHSETNDGRQVIYGYDRAGNRQSTQWPDATQYLVSYQYNALNKMQDVYEGTTTSGSLLAHYDYDILSRRQFLTYAGTSANKVSYGYEANDNLNSLSHQMASVGLTFGYGRNGSGQIRTLNVNDDFYLPRPSAASNTGYGVNRLNQYTAVGAIVGTESNGQPKIQGARGRFISIPFDDLSIVIPSVGIGRSPVDSAADPGGSTVVYDLNGNMRRWVGPDGVRNAYTYDAENRLRTATTSTHNVSYDYDARGRRISKTVDGVQTGYLLDGDEEIAEYNLSGGVWPSTPARRYVMGPVVDDRIAVVDATSGNAKNYYHVNHQGSVLATTDSSGNVVQRLSYDEYGNSGAGSTATGQVFRYTGRRFDLETGLYYYRARYYAPQIGRFLQTDPIGYGDDFNLYAYGGNDPLDKTDPSGNCPECAMGAGVIVFIVCSTSNACASFVAGIGRLVDQLKTPPLQPTSPPVVGVPPTPQSEERLPQWYDQPAVPNGSQATTSPSDSNVSIPTSMASQTGRTLWGNPNTLEDHFARHGKDFGAQSADDYAQQAADFLGRSQGEGLPTKIDADGVIRVYDPKSKTFGAYNADGTTRTFFKPKSPTYFDRQPGTPQ